MFVIRLVFAFVVGTCLLPCAFATGPTDGNLRPLKRRRISSAPPTLEEVQAPVKMDAAPPKALACAATSANIFALQALPKDLYTMVLEFACEDPHNLEKVTQEWKNLRLTCKRAYTCVTGNPNLMRRAGVCLHTLQNVRDFITPSPLKGAPVARLCHGIAVSDSVTRTFLSGERQLYETLKTSMEKHPRQFIFQLKHPEEEVLCSLLTLKVFPAKITCGNVLVQRLCREECASFYASLKKRAKEKSCQFVFEVTDITMAQAKYLADVPGLLHIKQTYDGASEEKPLRLQELLDCQNVDLCASLQSLNLEFGTGQCAEHIVFGSQFSNLKHLTLGYHNFSTLDIRLLPKLTDLVIADCRNLQGETWAKLEGSNIQNLSVEFISIKNSSRFCVKHLPRLRTLSFEQFSNFKTLCLGQLPQLEVINAKGCDSFESIVIEVTLPRLKKLTAEYCKEFRNFNTTRCPSLESFAFTTGYDTYNFCFNFEEN